MIENYDDLIGVLREKKMSTTNFEIKVSILCGRVWRLDLARDYSTKHGTFSATQKALFNSLMILNFEEFKKLGGISDRYRPGNEPE